VLGFAEALSREHPNKRSVLEEYAGWIVEARDPVGFARQYALENVARRHGLKADELETVVRAMKEFGPAVTLPGPGILRRANGFATAGAALALNAWTGGFAEEGGLSWRSDPLSDVAEELALPPARAHDPASLRRILQPLFEIKRSPVDVALCVEANPVHEFPGRDQIARALSHIPFLAAFSSHEDETSRLAHVTIPTLLELESWDLPAPGWGVPEPTLQVQRPALVPVVDARSVEDVILELASSGLAGPGFSPPAKDSRGMVAAAVQSIVRKARGELVAADGRRPLASVSSAEATKTLLAGESVWVPESEPGPRGPALAVQAAPARPAPDLAPQQLWLVPFDSAAIQRGRILNRPMMMELSGALHGLGWESWVEIHPTDARARDISSGDEVRLRGPRAEISCRAIVTRCVTPSVVAAPVGFGHEALGTVAAGRGSNPLELPLAVFDGNTGAPAWGPVPVFVVKA
jgi:molybdopterin-containing oxidoreductase family iron-sulfur binding subunit